MNFSEPFIRRPVATTLFAPIAVEFRPWALDASPQAVLDVPVAEEALLTARMMGNRAEHLYDVGVAGIHRLLEQRTAGDSTPEEHGRAGPIIQGRDGPG